ncbi:MAG TPA: preprotein translocase subunit SecE [Pirellulales bacterium]|nr:preprotein translocase subunit SecE [Pirellulales bacterium]
MMKEGNTATATLWRDLFSLGFYKRSQGRIARQATFIILALVVCLAGWSLLDYMSDKVLPFTNLLLGGEAAEGGAAAGKATYDAINGYARYLLPLALVFGGVWLAFRAVNVPRIADFLIAVEAEMNKVSWPSRTEMFRATLVVIFTIFGLAVILFGYDLLWRGLLQLLGVLPG